MDNNQSVFSMDGEVSYEYRAPLAEMPSSTNIPAKQVRRKSSFKTPVDSSEDVPSSHASIFEAIYASPNDSDEGGEGIGAIELVNIELSVSGATDIPIHNENNREGIPDIAAADDGDFLYGRGTVLDTITEQKSFGTFQTLANDNSMESMPNFPFVRHRDSIALGQLPRRKQAFSFDDIDMIQSSYHEACAMIEREAHKQVSVHEIYAEPRAPMHAPLERPLTPEGMPSWTASQDLPRATQSAQQTSSSNGNPLRRFFRFQGCKGDSSTTTNTRSVSDPIRGRQAPQFRPPRSVYGLIEQHPFNSAPIAQVIQPSGSTRNSTLKGKGKSKRKSSLQVRFTPSATARDSEVTALRTAIESTSASAPHPIMPFDGPTSPSLVRNIKCPHRKGRATLVKVTNSLNRRATCPPSNEYIIDAPSPNLDQSMNTPWPSWAPTPFRPASALSSVRSEEFGLMGSSIIPPVVISSTAHLMSGAIQSTQSLEISHLTQPEVMAPSDEPTPITKEVWCWKCKVQFVTKWLDHWATQTAGCFCFVCCGYDLKDDVSSSFTYSAADGRRIDYSGAPSLRGGAGEQLGPRMVLLTKDGSRRR